VPAKWIAAATSRQVSTGPAARGDSARGYGYQFWRSRHGYRADGAFGQFALVLPEHDAVVAITSGSDDTQAILELVWDKLLPALESQAQAPDDANARKLEARLANLMLPPRGGTLTPSQPERFSGKRYVFPESEGSPSEVSLEWNAAEQLATLTLLVQGRELRIQCRSGAWINTSPYPEFDQFTPYILALIELDEGVRMMSNVLDCSTERIRVGLRVKVRFETRGPGRIGPDPKDATKPGEANKFVSLPMFVPV
jgi:hypothetical protein